MTSTQTEGKAVQRTPSDALRTLTLIGSPIALATTLLLYFGWARSQAQADAFGADASVFDMSPQDLILRSVNILFFPIILLLLAGLFLVWIEPRLRARSATMGNALWLSWLAVPLGLLLLWLVEPVGYNLLPILVMVAIGGTAYGNLLRRYGTGDTRPPRAENVILVGALLIACLFWQTERLARAGGAALADDVQSHMAQRLPAVTLFSAGQMHIDGPGVQEEQVAAEGGLFTHRYDGLYLLQRSGGKYFLVTDGWTEDDGRLVVLNDSEDYRLEFGR